MGQEIPEFYRTAPIDWSRTDSLMLIGEDVGFFWSQQVEIFSLQGELGSGGWRSKILLQLQHAKQNTLPYVALLKSLSFRLDYCLALWTQTVLAPSPLESNFHGNYLLIGNMLRFHLCQLETGIVGSSTIIGRDAAYNATGSTIMHTSATFMHTVAYTCTRPAIILNGKSNTSMKQCKCAV